MQEQLARRTAGLRLFAEQGPEAWVLAPWLWQVEDLVANGAWFDRPALRTPHAVVRAVLGRPVAVSNHRGIAYLAFSPNEVRVLTAVLQAAGGQAMRPVALGSLRRVVAHARSSSWRRVPMNTALSRDVSSYGRLHVGLLSEAARRWTDTFSRWLGIWRPQVVVFATQHTLPGRAAILAAHRCGLPSVYLPHAPLADGPIYADLPFTWAALRGPAERDWYAEAGAARNRLEVVGDPSLPSSMPAGPQRRDRVLYAPSPIPLELLRSEIRLLRTVRPTGVVVSLHPRMKERSVYRRLIPSDWDVVSARRTFDAIATDAALVLHSGSGIALEANLLGVPTIRLDPGGGPPTYVFSEQLDYVAGDPRSLEAGLDRASAETVEDRRMRVGRARRWTAATGTAAAERALNVIREAARFSATPVLLDGWGQGSLTRDVTRRTK